MVGHVAHTAPFGSSPHQGLGASGPSVLARLSVETLPMAASLIVSGVRIAVSPLSHEAGSVPQSRLACSNRSAMVFSRACSDDDGMAAVRVSRAAGWFRVSWCVTCHHTVQATTTVRMMAASMRNGCLRIASDYAVQSVRSSRPAAHARAAGAGGCARGGRAG